MSEESKEKKILFISFMSGVLFAVVEFIFSIFSRSQSALMDAAYDASELIFIALTLFLTPLFHKPISEERPYGYFQVESIFLLIKGFMMISVTASISASIIQSALSGGNPVDGLQVSLFQLSLGIGCILIYLLMKRQGKDLASPTIHAELLGWKLDIVYSLGMSAAFFGSLFLEHSPLFWLSPYFDQIIAVVVVVMMLPETVKMLWSAIKDVFLFSPETEVVESIKGLCQRTLKDHRFIPRFYDITRTGRHIWISVYFSIREDSLRVESLQEATHQLNEKLGEELENCSCELILIPRDENVPDTLPEDFE